MILSKFDCKRQQFLYDDMYYIATAWEKLTGCFVGEPLLKKIMVYGKNETKRVQLPIVTASALQYSSKFRFK